MSRRTSNLPGATPMASPKIFSPQLYSTQFSTNNNTLRGTDPIRPLLPPISTLFSTTNQQQRPSFMSSQGSAYYNKPEYQPFTTFYQDKLPGFTALQQTIHRTLSTNQISPTPNNIPHFHSSNSFHSRSSSDQYDFYKEPSSDTLTLDIIDRPYPHSILNASAYSKTLSSLELQKSKVEGLPVSNSRNSSPTNDHFPLNAHQFLDTRLKKIINTSSNVPPPLLQDRFNSFVNAPPKYTRKSSNHLYPTTEQSRTDPEYIEFTQEQFISMPQTINSFTNGSHSGYNVSLKRPTAAPSLRTYPILSDSSTATSLTSIPEVTNYPEGRRPTQTCKFIKSTFNVIGPNIHTDMSFSVATKSADVSYVPGSPLIPLKFQTTSNAPIVIDTNFSPIEVNNHSQRAELEPRNDYTPHPSPVMKFLVISKLRTQSFEPKGQRDPSRRYQCLECFKRFTRPSSLKTHMNSHTGNKPFVCNGKGCGKRFSVGSNLRRHEKHCRLNGSRLNGAPKGRKAEQRQSKSLFHKSPEDNFGNQTTGAEWDGSMTRDEVSNNDVVGSDDSEIYQHVNKQSKNSNNIRNEPKALSFSTNCMDYEVAEKSRRKEGTK